jgi:DNA-binding NarL/FixJ family response regulator
MNRPRLVLVDDYEPAHEIYRRLLEPEVDVVAAVSDGEAALRAAEAHGPDLMVLDIEMGAMNGFSVARWLKKHMPGIKIVFLTMHAEPAYIKEAAAIGGEGYVFKRNAATELLETVRAVLAGSTHFPVLRTAR